MFASLEKFGLVTLTVLTIGVVGLFLALGLRQPSTAKARDDFKSPDIMSAELALRCDFDENIFYTDVLALLTSEDVFYVSQVRQELQKISANIVQAGDGLQRALQAYADDQKEPYHESISEAIADSNRWVAYSERLKNRDRVSRITIPIIFDRVHVTRLFLASPDKSTEITIAKAIPKLKLAFQSSLNTEKPKAAVQKAYFAVDLFNSKMCRPEQS